MNRKNTTIAIILSIVVVVLFIGLGFFGLGGFSSGTAQPASTGATPGQALLNEIAQTGTVADLRTEDTTLGTGDPVVAGDTLSVLYTGVLPDGTVFDSSQAHGGQPFSFTVGTGQVIKGWEQGLLGMKEGGRRLLAIPPSLGYGAQVVGSIPANSTLIFDVQLVKRTPAGSAPAQ